MTRTERMKAAIAAKPVPAAAPAKPAAKPSPAPAIVNPVPALTPEAHPAKPVGLAPRKTRRVRLPDGSRFELRFTSEATPADPAAGFWSGSLVVPRPEKAPVVLQGRAHGVFDLLERLDGYWRLAEREEAGQPAAAEAP
ncbi:MAG TPA: hypothetical protein VGI99_12055 [Gemmataceae bacterium]|jgi:hypothetical protein